MVSPAPLRDQSKRRVCYYYDTNVGNYYYGPGHVMKPHRIRMANELILSYGLYQNLSIYRPLPASFEAMTTFHSDEYITFLRDAKIDNLNSFGASKGKFSQNNDDCPLFDGLYEFCQLSCGGSLAAAIKLNKKKTDIAINWMGGLHHAKKSESSGFCYTNDIVVGILELLKFHKRVLYVDIDIHHGDGVEEAFFDTNRVMTVSFHRFGNFFPGTGDIKDVGIYNGKLYSVNVPLSDGITDESYQKIFVPVMEKVMEMFDPQAVVLQCGADSLYGDRLGKFNLSLRGHGACAEFFRKYDVPLMMVGGGGYTPRNVARCWAYETSIAVGIEVPNELPFNNYYEYFGPDYKLHIEPSKVLKNDNSDQKLHELQKEIYENLSQLDKVPSVQMQPLENDTLPVLEFEDIARDEENPDVRLPMSIMDSCQHNDADFYDDENGGDDHRNEANGRLSTDS
ncbi:hypothetical protein B9Z55_009335 [Caenorhabditis nigoni]|uniref:Histone deacetylase n=1 Tax=Caenorhabditis nigoni TaxID=1611254 RepID=A0A2G5US14_9PELO|nr:hypothetical protein B9Z55_009335 [Caenorhabditis nigoni]